MADPGKIEQAVKNIRNQKAFIHELLIDALGWDLDNRAEDVEEISFKSKRSVSSRGDQLRVEEISFESRRSASSVRAEGPAILPALGIAQVNGNSCKMTAQRANRSP
jgi:hypothetical protein